MHFISARIICRYKYGKLEAKDCEADGAAAVHQSAVQR